MVQYSILQSIDIIVLVMFYTLCCYGDDDEYCVIIGFYDYILELNGTLAEEEHHEEEIFAQQKLEC